MSNLFDIAGRKAIVTGATRGLGKAMAEGLMESGAEVAVIGRSPRIERVAKEFVRLYVNSWGNPKWKHRMERR
ncbi:MAG: hypothetical protein ACFWUC_04450 [Oscillospiraceae bacterium]